MPSYKLFSSIQFLRFLSQEKQEERILLITGSSLGGISEIKAIVKALGKYKTVFHIIRRGEPTLKQIRATIQVIERERITSIWGIGGGSTIDMAKVCATANLKELDKMLKTGSANFRARSHKLIVIPTTAGSGSEATNIAVITENGKKRSFVCPCFYPDHAFLIPDLVKHQKPDQAMHSSIDALSHAVEAYLSPQATSASDQHALLAICIFRKKLKRDYMKRSVDRGQMLVASYHAGRAIALAGAGAIHALSYPLTNVFHFQHGLANAILFQGVMDYFFTEYLDRKRFSVLAKALGTRPEKLSDAIGKIIERARILDGRELRRKLNMKMIPKLAEQSLVYQRLWGNSPIGAPDKLVAAEMYRRSIALL